MTFMSVKFRHVACEYVHIAIFSLGHFSQKMCFNCFLCLKRDMLWILLRILVSFWKLADVSSPWIVQIFIMLFPIPNFHIAILKPCHFKLEEMKGRSLVVPECFTPFLTPLPNDEMNPFSDSHRKSINSNKKREVFFFTKNFLLQFYFFISL